MEKSKEVTNGERRVITELHKKGQLGVKVLTRKKLFDIMQQQNLSSLTEKLDFIENYLLNYDNYEENQIKHIKHKFSYVKSEFKRRWIAAQKKLDLFLKKNDDWLLGTFELPRMVQRSGRPTKTFDESSDRSKRRKTEVLRTTDINILSHATQMKLWEEGKRDASRVLKDITSSPTRATKYAKSYSSSMQKSEKQLSPLHALSMIVEAGLSRRQYEVVRRTKRSLYPCYSLIQKEKLGSYPDKSSYLVTENYAEIKLQNLLDHTVTRLLLYLEEIVQNLSTESSRLRLICKWGCDGSQQTQYKQKFLSDEDSDAYIFQSSFVPLQLICDISKNVIWQNPTTSSPRHCRPIRIRFVKESVDIINEEISYIQNSIDSLKETKVTLDNKNFYINHTMLLTMIDGKVCNAATKTTSTMMCYICGATSKDFNNLTIRKNINIDNLKFGLSVLHARIRIFESLLHLSYKLPLKKWRMVSNDDKEVVKERKLQIQKEFKKRIGLIVDVPKTGFGNSNDGNTSRRFFNDPIIASEITGVDAQLIHRFKVILEIISCQHKINTQKFSEYTMETAKLYVKLYPWYPMTPTMHKILIHAAIVIENALLPIGQLSEEAAEANNKNFREYRINFARKFSRTSCNVDIINRLLLNSDPLLSNMRSTPRRKSLPYMKETLQILLPSEPPNLSTSTVSDSSSDDNLQLSDQDDISSNEEW